MQLTYRGANYEYDPTTAGVMESEDGKYRGQEWRYRYPRHIPTPVPQPARHLKYRGAAYRSNSRVAVEAAFAASGFEVPQNIVIALKCHPVVDEVTEMHQANIRRRLEYRLQIAKNRGDEKLMRMLEAESKQLVGQFC